MNPEQVTVLMRALKGAPLSCLVLMLMHRRPLGAKVLAQRTAYHINTVETALSTLAGLGLAVKTGRFESWQLTDKGRQLPLFDMDDYPELEDDGVIESEKFRLDEGGQSEQLQLMPPVGVAESEKFRLDEEFQPQSLGPPSAIESEKFRLDHPNETEPSLIESEKFRLDSPEAGLNGQNSGIESEKFRLDEPLVGTHGTHDVLRHDDVLNTDSTETLKHHHESGTPTLAHEEIDPEQQEAIIQAAANIFWEAGHTLPNATRLATNLVNQYGAERVRRQVDFFPDRVGLEKPAGAFTDSVKFDWPPRPKPKDKAWYTEEEFKTHIQH